MPRTKIVCTIGPASSDPQTIRALIEHGMSIARLNFSHGTHEDHAEKIELIRNISKELGLPVGILQDLCGPKIRVGEIAGAGIRLERGETLTLTTDTVDGEGRRVSVSYASLPDDVKVGEIILLADGLMELVVEKKTPTDIACRVLTGGLLTSHKGINLPTGTLKTPILTEKDYADLAFGLDHDVDYVALSFVRSADDVALLKNKIHQQGHNTPVIAKIEKHEALADIENIMDMTDGVMVARGDLGVEIPLEKVPGIQKQLVAHANRLGKPVIIATQMLRSMVDSPRPTRAEATDVANGVLDGADAMMLSEETASGKYPVEAVKFMHRMAEAAEENYPHTAHHKEFPNRDVSQSVAFAACILADDLKAAAIVATTRSGFTAKQISRFRPRPRIIALSPDEKTVRQLCLYWGCYPCHVDDMKDTDELIEKTTQAALDTKLVSKGDIVVITAGHPVWKTGTTNMMQVKTL